MWWIWIIMAGIILLSILFRRVKSIKRRGFNRRRLASLSESIIRYNEQLDSAAAVYNDMGLDGDKIVNDIGLVRTDCMALPDENGNCPNPSFVLNNGCCQLKDSTDSGGGIDKLEFINELAIGYISGEIIEAVGSAIFVKGPDYLMKQVIEEATSQRARKEGTGFIIEEATEEATERGMKKLLIKTADGKITDAITYSIKEGTEAAMKKASKALIKQMTGKLLQEILEKVIGRIISNAIAKVITKSLAFMARIMLMMSFGPVGVMGAVIDVLMEIPDLFDFAGFNLYSSNQINLKLRNSCEYNFAKSLENANAKYPQLFDLSQVYPKEVQSTIEAVQGAYIELVIEEVILLPGGIEELIIPTGDTPIFDNAYQNLLDRDHLAFNLMFHDVLNSILPVDRPYEIKLYTSFSAPMINAVSLTEDSAKRWNDEHTEEWFNYLSGDLEYKEGEGPPLSIVFTDKYGVVNTDSENQDSDTPEMIDRTLPGGRVPLAGVHYMVMKECLDKRSPMRMPRSADRSGDGIVTDVVSGMMELQFTGSGSLNPSSYGVTFNSETRTCKFTPSYCREVGLKYIASGASGTSDCKLWPGQYEAELIFGTSLTRGFIKWGNDPGKELKDGFQETIINMWQNPERWGDQYRNITIRSGDMIKNGAEGLLRRAANFSDEFAKNPATAVGNFGVDAYERGTEVALLINPTTYAHQACETLGGTAGTLCTTGVVLAFPPLSLVYGLVSLERNLGIFNAIGLGGNNPYNPIFFQLDEMGNEKASHEHKDVNDKKKIEEGTVVIFFNHLNKGNKPDGDEYYAKIFRNGRMVANTLKPNKETKLLDVSEYADGRHIIIFKH